MYLFLSFVLGSALIQLVVFFVFLFFVRRLVWRCGDLVFGERFFVMYFASAFWLFGLCCGLCLCLVYLGVLNAHTLLHIPVLLLLYFRDALRDQTSCFWSFTACYMTAMGWQKHHR